MSEPLLSVKGLGRRVEERWLWRALDFDLPSGRGTALVGPSGSGKTLLMRVLSGLDEPQEGEISFEGRSLQEWNLPLYRTKIMYLHQRPQFAQGTVEDNLQSVFQWETHRPKHYNPTLHLTLLEEIGWNASLLSRPVAKLSGGESQIVALMRAIQLKPQLLMLDEPTAALDHETTLIFEKIIHRWLSEDHKRAYLWTSHDVNQLQRVTQEQILLKSSL